MASKQTRARDAEALRPPADAALLKLARLVRYPLTLGCQGGYRLFGQVTAPRYAGRSLLLDQELTGRHLIWTGTTGSGKTFGAAHQVQQAMQAGANVVVLDPHALMIR